MYPRHLLFTGELMLPNWKPAPLMDICSDKEKSVIEVLGQLRVPPTLKIRIRFVRKPQ